MFFSSTLQTELKAAGFTPADTSFLKEMCERFPDVKEGFEKCASLPSQFRAAFTGYALKEVKRSGWRRIGVPEDDIQTVGEHSGSCLIMAAVLYDNMRVAEMMTIHDMTESIVTDFTPHDPITPQEKHRLEKLGLSFALAGSLAKDRTMAMWMEFEEQKTEDSHQGFDIDKLEMILQAQVYEGLYPHLKDRLAEFWSYVDTRIKTVKGRAFFEELKQIHPGPHPLKIALDRPSGRPWMDILQPQAYS